MIQLILKRLFTYIPVLLVVVIITFLMIHAAPGGPFDAERVAAPEIIEKLNEAYNLDKPIHVQIYNYLFNAIQGDFGPSFKYPGRSVTELIMSGLPTTIELAIYSILFAIFCPTPEILVSFEISSALIELMISEYSRLDIILIAILLPTPCTVRRSLNTSLSLKSLKPIKVLESSLIIS